MGRDNFTARREVRRGRVLADGPLSSVVEVQRGAIGRRGASVGTRGGQFYNPSTSVASAIADSLNAEKILRESPGTITVSGGGGPVVVVRAGVITETEYAVKIQVYSWRGWFKRRWVELRPGGTVAIASHILSWGRFRGLRQAITHHRELRASMMGRKVAGR